MNQGKERRLLVVRCCMLFVVLVSWAIFFAYLFSLYRATGTEFGDMIGLVFVPSLLVLVGTALFCAIIYFIYRTALIKIR